MKHFIPTWDWFVDTEIGKKLLTDNADLSGLIATAFKLGMDAAQSEVTINPTSGLETGVWFNDAHFYRYHGKLPILVESEIPMRPKQFVVLSGCISCQVSKVTGRVKRWMVLPP